MNLKNVKIGCKNFQIARVENNTKLSLRERPKEKLKTEQKTLFDDENPPFSPETEHNLSEEFHQEKIDKSQKKSKIKKPNFYLSLPITNEKLKTEIGKFKSEMAIKTGRKEPLQKTELHVTVGLVNLKTGEEERSINVLKKIDFSKAPKLHVKGIGSFKGKIFYARFKDEDEILNRYIKRISNDFYEGLKKIGIKGDCFTPIKNPHMTLFRMKRKNVEIKRMIDCDRSFGEQNIEKVEFKSIIQGSSKISRRTLASISLMK